MTATRHLPHVCAMLLLCASMAGAQEILVPGAVVFKPRTYEPPQITSPSLTLSDAVRLTVLHSPTLSTSTQTLEQAIGRSQELRGAFDASVVVGPKVKFALQPLMPAVERLEITQREAYKQLGETFGALAVDLRQMAANLQPHAPACPQVYLNLSSQSVALPSMPGLNGAAGHLSADQAQQLDDQGVNLNSFSLGSTPALVMGMGLCELGGTKDVDALMSWYRVLVPVSQVDYRSGYGLGGILNNVAQMPRELLTSWAQISDLVSTRAYLGYQRVGDVPKGIQQRMIQLGATYYKPFRSGIQLAGTFQVQGIEDGYSGKSLDPAFGGNPTPNRFPTTLSLSLTLPIGKGRGAVSVTASERAARFGVEAQRDQFRAVAAEEVFRTVLAYFALAAAKDSVALLEESVARQATLVALATQRVDAGEIPAMELNRARARAAAVNASLTVARTNLVTSQLGLAQSIGADASGPAVMLTSADRLPTGRASIAPVADLVRLAAATRRDTRALNQLRLAYSAIDAGARADLKRRLDLSVTAGIKNNYESQLFRYMPDEVQPIYSDFNQTYTYDSPVRYYNPRGVWYSMTKRFEPFVQTSLSFDMPLANSAARGRLAQTQADLRSRDVEMAELDRSIRENIMQAKGAAEVTAVALERAEATVQADDQVLTAAVDRFKVGEVTLIDTLTTEEQVTTDKLDVVRLRQAYIAALARLRFETGELLRFVTDKAGIEVLAFEPASLLGK